jgi:hypothetical protein
LNCSNGWQQALQKCKALQAVEPKRLVIEVSVELQKGHCTGPLSILAKGCKFSKLSFSGGAIP